MILEESRTKYILGAFAFFLILIGAVVAFQQITINNLKKGQAGENATALKSTAINSPFTVQAVQKTLTDNIKEIKGTIISKTESLLTIEAEVVDFSKLSKLSEDELHQNMDSFPKIKKKYEVSVNKKTQFTALKFEDLSVGTVIIVESEDLVYTSDRINASKITVIAQGGNTPLTGTSIKDQMDQIKTVSGGIKEINSKYLTIGVIWTDYSKIENPFSGDSKTSPKIAKDYKVFFADKTVFSKSGKSDLKVGDDITAYSNNPTFYVSEFTATKIDGPLPKVSNLPDFPGQVISRGDGVLTVKAADEYGGKTYTVKVTNQTLLYKIEHAANPPKQSDITFSDIRENDQVWILATGSIDDKSEFEAMGVSLQL